MTVKQIYDELMSHSPEWRRAFFELVKVFKEAKPEHQLMILNTLKEMNTQRGDGSHDVR